jgi:hypothetical protein
VAQITLRRRHPAAEEKLRSNDRDSIPGRRQQVDKMYRQIQAIQGKRNRKGRGVLRRRWRNSVRRRIARWKSVTGQRRFLRGWSSSGGRNPHYHDRNRGCEDGVVGP